MSPTGGRRWLAWLVCPLAAGMAARPSGGTYMAHATVQCGAFGYAVLLIGGALLGAITVSRTLVRGVRAQDGVRSERVE